MYPGTPEAPLQTPGALTPARLRRAKELMLHSPLSIIEIAAVCNLTRSHFQSQHRPFAAGLAPAGAHGKGQALACNRGAYHPREPGMRLL